MDHLALDREHQRTNSHERPGPWPPVIFQNFRAETTILQKFGTRLRTSLEIALRTDDSYGICRACNPPADHIPRGCKGNSRPIFPTIRTLQLSPSR
jgi:hypothetical protein